MNLMQTSERPLANLCETFLECSACVIRHGKNLLAGDEARKPADDCEPKQCEERPAQRTLPRLSQLTSPSARRRTEHYSNAH